MNNTAQYDWAKNIPCRNIQIHGFCKFEHKGCSYNHDFATSKNNSLGGNGTGTGTGTGTGNVSGSGSGSADTSTITSVGNNSSTAALSQASASSQMTTGGTANSSPIAASISKAPIFKPSLLKQSASTEKNININLNNNSNLTMTSNTTSPSMNKKFNLDSPAFTPTSLANKFASLSPSLDHIPTFVPSAISNGLSETEKVPEAATIASTLKGSLNSGLPTNTASYSINNTSSTKTSPETTFTDFAGSLRSSLTKSNSFNPITAPIFTPNPSLSNPNNELMNPMNAKFSPQVHVNPVDDDLFYQNTNLYPVNFLLYAPPPPPHIELNKNANERTVDDLFIDNKLREYLQLKNEESLKSISNNELDLPLHVGQYHSLYPIDHNFDYNTKSFGYTSIVYKCMSNEDGKLYTMRRLKNVPITSPSVLKSIKKWKKVDCANCVKIYDVFTTRAFNDNSLILIYDYYPMSLTLMENHFMSFPGKNPDLITEDSLWNYTIQLLNAITEINKLNLSIGMLNPSKIIITNKGRIRLSSLGIDDILNDVKLMKPSESNSTQATATSSSDKGSNINTQLKEADESGNKDSDLLSLGKLILFLAKSTTYMKTPTESPLEIISQLKFTNVFKKMLAYLFTEDATIERFQELVAPMILKLTNGLQNSCDHMESNLMTELENARLVRLFAKLDFITERSEMVKDGPWSETGERYPIKLFKDYVFHQVDESGKPVVDLTHIIDCLNKLDAGVDENLLLISPDEMTCLIMSYKDLKELVNKSFLSLLGKE